MGRYCVFFDLDDTILDFGEAEKAGVGKALREYGVEPTESILKRYSQLNALCWEQMEDGLITREEVLALRFDLLFRELGVELSGEEVNRRYELLLHQGHWFMPGAPELLRELQGSYRLFIVSNGVGSVQDSRIASAGIAGYFEGIYISDRMGYHKPRREFFEACFETIPDFDRERSIIVGDSLTSDIRGGLNAGVKTCWYNGRGKPGREDIRPDYEIATLSELPALLKKLDQAI